MASNTRTMKEWNLTTLFSRYACTTGGPSKEEPFGHEATGRHQPFSMRDIDCVKSVDELKRRNINKKDIYMSKNRSLWTRAHLPFRPRIHNLVAKGTKNFNEK